MAIQSIQQLDKTEYKECLLLLQDLNLVSDLLAYDYTYFEMVYPSVTKQRYKLLKQIVEGKHDKLSLLFLKYRYHDYGNNCDGYIDIFDNSKYERLSADLQVVSWKSNSNKPFQQYTVIYSFKGRKFEFCELIVSVDEGGDLCLARKNAIFDKNFV